jgi:Rieske Fe-S protein
MASDRESEKAPPESAKAGAGAKPTAAGQGPGHGTGSGNPGGSSRRGFFVFATVACAGAVGLIAAVPGLGFLLAPARGQGGGGGPAAPVRVASLSDLTPGQPTRADVVATVHDAWNRFDGVRLGAVWLIRSQDGAHVQAFSTVCPHLGCAIDWDPQSSRFACPCHGSVFGVDGQRQAGPSPRPMDALDVTLEGDDVSVAYARFKQGVGDKEPA